MDNRSTPPPLTQGCGSRVVIRGLSRDVRVTLTSSDTLWGYPWIIQGCQSYSDIRGHSDNGVGWGGGEQLSANYPGMSELL